VVTKFTIIRYFNWFEKGFTFSKGETSKNSLP
jgi:hypothetical protein